MMYLTLWCNSDDPPYVHVKFILRSLKRKFKNFKTLFIPSWECLTLGTRLTSVVVGIGIRWPAHTLTHTHTHTHCIHSLSLHLLDHRDTLTCTYSLTHTHTHTHTHTAHIHSPSISLTTTPKNLHWAPPAPLATLLFIQHTRHGHIYSHMRVYYHLSSINFSTLLRVLSAL